MLLLRLRFSLCGFYFGSKLLRVTLCGANGTGLLPPTNKEHSAVFSAAFPLRCRFLSMVLWGMTKRPGLSPGRFIATNKNLNLFMHYFQRRFFFGDGQTFLHAVVFAV